MQRYYHSLILQPLVADGPQATAPVTGCGHRVGLLRVANGILPGQLPRRPIPQHARHDAGEAGYAFSAQPIDFAAQEPHDRQARGRGAWSRSKQMSSSMRWIGACRRGACMRGVPPSPPPSQTSYLVTATSQGRAGAACGERPATRIAAAGSGSALAVGLPAAGSNVICASTVCRSHCAAAHWCHWRGLACRHRSRSRRTARGELVALSSRPCRTGQPCSAAVADGGRPAQPQSAHQAAGESASGPAAAASHQRAAHVPRPCPVSTRTSPERGSVLQHAREGAQQPQPGSALDRIAGARPSPCHGAAAEATACTRRAASVGTLGAAATFAAPPGA